MPLAATAVSPDTRSQRIPGIDPELIDAVFNHPLRRSTLMHSGRDHRSLMYGTCTRMDRSLLTLARFTLSRRHHRHTLGLAEPVSELHPIHRVSTGQYSVLAVIQYIGRPAAVDIARSLTLHRTTVLRHLQALEAAGLVMRDLGQRDYPFGRPLFTLTLQGRAAMRLAQRSRVRRLERVASSWPPALRELVASCLEELAAELHDEVGSCALPQELGGHGHLPTRHVRWKRRRPPTEAEMEPIESRARARAKLAEIDRQEGFG